MKRAITLFLALILMLSMFAGCSDGGNATEDKDTGKTTETEKSTDAKDAQPTVTAAGELPIVTEPTTLSIFLRTGSAVDDHENNKFTDYLVENTGINFEFVTAPSDDAKTKLNLLLNSGDYPGLILNPLNPSEMNLYASEGVFLPLDDYEAEYGYYVKDAFERYPMAKETCTAMDGNLYALPAINDAYHVARNGRLWGYVPFMDKLSEAGMEIPSTTEEFYEFLKYIKDNDVNGNGDPNDEIPLLSYTGNVRAKLVFYFMNSFITYTNTGYRVSEDGKIEACFADEGYKEGLRYLNKLYSEDLILKEAFTIDQDEAKRLTENEDPIVGFFPGHGPDAANSYSERWHSYLTIPPLEGPDGTRNALYNPSFGQPAGFITDKCENPEAAFRLMDFFYNDVTSKNLWIGPEGTNWEYTDDATLGGANGEPAKFKTFFGFGDVPINDRWDQQVPRLFDDQLNVSFAVEGVDDIIKYIDTKDPSFISSMVGNSSYNETMKYYQAKNYYNPYVYSVDTIVPPLLYDDVESAEIADLSVVLEAFVEESFVAFVTGAYDVDKDWDNYLADLEGLRLDDYLQIVQTAYDRK